MPSFPPLALAGAALASLGAAPAFAQVSDVSFNVGAASEYVLRGVSQTDENPQVFAGVDAALWGSGYAGAWVSNVDFNDGTKAEVDIYGGWKPKVGPVTLDLGGVFYTYVNQPGSTDYDYFEWKLGASMPIGPANIGAVVYHSDDFFAGSGKATYYEVRGDIPVAEKVVVSGAFGHQEVAYSGDYSTWNLGASYALNNVVGFDLRYYDTDEHDLGDIYGSRVVLGVKAAF